MPLLATQLAEYVIVQAAVAGSGVENIGILLLDPENNQAHFRFRRDWESVAGQEDAEYLRELPDDLAAKARELGAAELLSWMEEHLSNFLRVSDRESTLVSDFESSIERLYQKHVKPKVLPFRTHLPLYSLQAAAGKFGENMEVEEEAWVEAPERLRLTDDMFVAHVTGRSMEPKIPNGSLCVFRYNVTGSRQGKLVLVMNYGESGENRFTIKRYTSQKAKSAEGWQHSRIRLEPLNPEYEAWDLDPEDTRLKIVGEFVAILSSPGQEL